MQVTMQHSEQERQSAVEAFNELQEIHNADLIKLREYQMQNSELQQEGTRAKELQQRVEQMEGVVRRTLEEEHQAGIAGWLKKLGTTTKMFAWCTRWCELQRGVLAFWEAERQGNEAAMSIVPLAEITEISASQQKPFAFKVVRKGYEHPIFLEAGSADDRQVWMEAIQLARTQWVQMKQLAAGGMDAPVQGEIATLRKEVSRLEKALERGQETACAIIDKLLLKHERFSNHTTKFDHQLWSWFERVMLSGHRVNVPPGALLEAISATLESPTHVSTMDSGFCSPNRHTMHHDRPEVEDWCSF